MSTTARAATDPADPADPVDHSDAITTLVQLAGARDPLAGGSRVVAVDGPSGSGKTTFAERLAAGLDGAQIVHMDDLYPGWDGLAAAVPVLVEAVLQPLSEGRAGSYRRYDWGRGEYAESCPVPVAPWIVIEGAGCGSRAGATYLTAIGWLTASRDIRRGRGLTRDGATYAPHWERWSRQETRLFAAEDTRARADLVLDTSHGSNPTRPAGTMDLMEPPDMMDAVLSGLAERTGRTLPEWVELVAASGIDPLDQKAVRAWLKTEHRVPQNSQWAIADAAAREAGWTSPSLEAATAALYSGAEASLRPLHDAIVEMTHSLGDDVEAQVRASYIPLRRRTQFLALAPGPRGTLRVGLRFRDDVPDDERLSPTTGFAQATHVLHIGPDALDADLITLEPLIATAYEQNG